MQAGADELNTDLVLMLKKLDILAATCLKTPGGKAVFGPVMKLQSNLLATRNLFRRRKGGPYIQQYREKIEAFKTILPKLKGLKGMPASIINKGLV